MVYECGCEGDGVDAHRPRSSATPEIRDAECWRPGVSTPPSVQSLYLTYQNGIEAKRCLMPRTHHTSATLRLSSVTCVLRTMCVKLANEEDIFVYSTVWTSVCFNSRPAKRILMKFDTNVTCLAATQSSHSLIFYDRSFGCSSPYPSHYTDWAISAGSSEKPLRFYTVTELHNYHRQILTPHVILLKLTSLSCRKSVLGPNEPHIQQIQERWIPWPEWKK